MSNWCGRHMIRHSATLPIIVTIFPTTPIVPALWHREQSSSLSAHPLLFIYQPLMLWRCCSLSHSVRTYRNLLGLRKGLLSFLRFIELPGQSLRSFSV